MLDTLIPADHEEPLSPSPCRMLAGDCAQGCTKPCFLEAHGGLLLAERGAVLAQKRAGKALRRPELLHRHAHGTTAGLRAQNFPFATSLKMSIASSFSASRRLSRAFSFSSSLVRLDASAFFSDPY